jgi:phosphohistidine phosphatase
VTKFLYLFRHAEAEQPAGGAYDYRRTLSPHGMIDAARMGRLLKSKIPLINEIVSSPSERTRMTAFVLAEQMGFDENNIVYDEKLYEGAPRHYLAAINHLAETHDHALLVGHNPSITYLAEYLTHEDLGNVPTAGVVAIAFDNLSWSQVSARTGKLLFYDSPETLLGMNIR